MHLPPQMQADCSSLPALASPQKEIASFLVAGSIAVDPQG
jgi:hypothetical protein